MALSATYIVAALVDILLRFGITSKKFVDNLLGWEIYQLVWPIAKVVLNLFLLWRGSLLVARMKLFQRLLWDMALEVSY